MECYVKIFPIKDGYKAVENEINKHLRRGKTTTKIVSISGLGEHHIIAVFEKEAEPTTVANPDTPTETDFKYFTAEQVRNMSQKEVKENYQDIMKSMKKWG